MRSNYERFGTAMYFDEQHTLLGIYWKEHDKFVTTNDVEFPHVRLLLCANVMMSITIKDHLAMVHWLISNAVLINSERFLSATHPLRRLIRPHTYNAANVNASSLHALAPKNGLAIRLCGFSTNSWGDLCTNVTNEFVYESIEETFVKRGLDDKYRTIIPYYQDGMEFWNILEKYISNYIHIMYNNDGELLADAELVEYWNGMKEYHKSYNERLGELNMTNLIKQLTHFVYWVTGGHSYVGSVQEYLYTMNSLGGKVCKNTTKHPNVSRIDIQTYFQQIALICLTSVPMPLLINDWSHLYEIYKDQLEKHQKILNNLNEWQNELKALSASINNRNMHRLQPFDWMNPACMNCSVSV
jgi:hypothetical protein